MSEDDTRPSEVVVEVPDEDWKLEGSGHLTVNDRREEAHEVLGVELESGEDESGCWVEVSCPGCGTLLGRFGDDSAGSDIDCPNCNEWVTIP